MTMLTARSFPQNDINNSRVTTHQVVILYAFLPSSATCRLKR